MKRLISIAALLIFSFSTNAQLNFAPIGAQWFTKNGWSEVWNGGYTYCMVEKDTIYNGIVCRKVMRLALEQDEQNSVDTQTMTPLYVYTTPDTIFYYNTLFDEFVPLYIFNVSPGMTLSYHMPFVMIAMPPDSMFQIHINSVGEEIIDGVTLRKINGTVVNWAGMDPGYTYIEQLGLLDKQLIPQEEDMHASYNHARLRCYQDTMINYHRYLDMPCDTIPGYTGISELAQQHKNVSVYPNPVQEDWLQVQLHADPGKIMQVQVYSITGACLTTRLNSDYAQRMRLNVGDLPPGIYQLKVSRDGQVIGSGRFVKQ